MLKLDWNESTVPPSPLVKERLIDFVRDEDFSFLYPSTHNPEVMSLLSNYTGLPQENIQYFPSSDSLHECLVRSYLSLGDNVLLLAPTYDNFRLTCEAQGAKVNFCNYVEGYLFDEEVFKRSIFECNPKLVYICNPNNPTGTFVPVEILCKLIRNFPDVMFLIDEAYVEFSKRSVALEVINLKNLLVTRTFSKAFGLANFRAGYLLADHNNISDVSRIRNSKNFPTLTQIAVVAVLSDITYMQQYVEEVIRARSFFSKKLLGFSFVNKIYESEGNFLLVDFVNTEWRNRISEFLEGHKIFVRSLNHDDTFAKSLRITIGTTHQMREVLGLLDMLKC
jgi:histidinol-phosphate aminotransferase